MSNLKLKDINVTSNWDVRIQNPVCYSEDRSHVFLKIEDLSLLGYDGVLLVCWWLTLWRILSLSSWRCSSPCRTAVAAKYWLFVMHCLPLRKKATRLLVLSLSDTALHPSSTAVRTSDIPLKRPCVCAKQNSVTPQNTVVVLILTTYWNSNHKIFFKSAVIVFICILYLSGI